MNAHIEFITVMLIAQGLPEEIAQEAAKLIHEKSDELILASEKSLVLLIDAFVAVYRQDASRALQILEEKLI